MQIEARKDGLNVCNSRGLVRGFALLAPLALMHSTVAQTTVTVDRPPEEDKPADVAVYNQIFNRALSQEEIQDVMTGFVGTAATTAAAPPAPQASEDPAIFRAEGPIAVDGDLSDWSQRGPIVADSSLVVADVPEVENDSDLSVSAHYAYDDNWLYVGAEVTDDVLIFERTGDAIWQTDAFEFWLGSQQFGVAISDASPYLHSFGELDIEEAEVALTPGDGGYTVEVALPRAVLEEALEMTFEEGTSVPVAVGADDSDEEGAERQGQVYFPEGWAWNEVDTFAPLDVTP